jgi:hypothetical protein
LNIKGGTKIIKTFFGESRAATLNTCVWRKQPIKDDRRNNPKNQKYFLFKMNGRGKKSSCLAAKSGKK